MSTSSQRSKKSLSQRLEYLVDEFGLAVWLETRVLRAFVIIQVVSGYSLSIRDAQLEGATVFRRADSLTQRIRRIGKAVHGSNLHARADTGFGSNFLGKYVDDESVVIHPEADRIHNVHPAEILFGDSLCFRRFLTIRQ